MNPPKTSSITAASVVLFGGWTVAGMRHCCQFEGMKQASLLQRIGTYLLGLVDEYWAMRRPWQYGAKEPQCGLQCDGDHCERTG